MANRLDKNPCVSRILDSSLNLSPLLDNTFSRMLEDSLNLSSLVDNTFSRILEDSLNLSSLVDNTLSRMLDDSLDFSSLVDNTFSRMLDQLQILNSPLGFSWELPFGWTSLPDLLVHPKARLAARLGWVVHHTLPRSLLEGTAAKNLDQAIITYYRENWVSVREEIELAASNCPIDHNSKETMNQALAAHEHGLYRLVPPATVVGIERAIRIQLRGGVVGQIDVKETLLGQVDDLPISVFSDFMSGQIQYETVDEHLYEKIKDETDRHPFAESPIPNRHATVHGLVHYSSEKSSLNSIFLLDFVFSLLARIREERITELTAILKSHVQRQDARQREDKVYASGGE